MSYPVIPLIPGKEAAIGFWHPWIFSGALSKVPEGIEHGELVWISDRQGAILGTGTFSNKSSIAVRVFAFGEAVIDRAWLVAKLKASAERRVVTVSKDTTAFRGVFGEADGIPGLVVDRYGDVIVFQISTKGLDRMREDVVAALDEAFAPSAIVERSDIAVRREEGLNDFVAI